MLRAQSSAAPLYYLFVRRQRGLSFPPNGEQLPPVSPEKSGHETHAPQDPNIFVPEEALHCKKKKEEIPLPLLASACYFSFSAAGGLSAERQAVDIWQDVGPPSQNIGVLRPLKLRNDSQLSSSSQTHECGGSAVEPPARPANHRPLHPASLPALLPPLLRNHPGPKRRGHAVCEMRI